MLTCDQPDEFARALASYINRIMLRSDSSISIDDDLKPIIWDLDTDVSMLRQRRPTDNAESDDEA